MKFEYIGFRPIISQHGITFKQGKDDKFIYFPYAYGILNALNHDYTANNSRFSDNIKIEDTNIDKLYKIVEKYFPNIDKAIEDKLKIYNKHLEEEKENIKLRPHLNDIEKNTYLSNLDLMRNYRVNRAKNKIFYYFVIATIAEVIKEKRIKEIDIPYNNKFWHVLNTLQGVLSSEKISSNIKVTYIDTQLELKFTTSLV
ncbi:hypothetical protein CRU87_02000 [Aliarcobacter trophiarum LMG 25534]|uniref:Uncharacterized protein n=1 Tax=Aliarcobacter trophiarum LMG 25534 TaxID=1032241 RepID=A0AAD0QJ59_9BACT|nr:hypothetical protein [Aliarcobacter trophiarum]AXK48838.1 hypothetical protein ATR_0974 [Aliarcobacter trophiarum LMG 25534]RXI24983.1 hypothetical protein CRU89_09230 [Aliarcobacter trophiarum]RXJ92575.1 hypothetical protein CRU87_02000 [Aliarcobacter trophiarum LMG 25534]